MDAVSQAIKALADAHQGTLTPDQVVEAAKSPDSPLHPKFQWDDSLAAIEHRRAQARQLIRSVRIEYRTTTFSFEAPAFIRSPDAGREQGYSSAGRLRSNEDLAREAVVTEFARASAALRRAQEVAAALGLSEEIASLEGEIVRLSGRASQSTGEVAAS